MKVTIVTVFFEFLVLSVFIGNYLVEAFSPIALTPSTTPEQIIQSQLTALQVDDMQGVYQLASPANKARTGDIESFSQMVKAGPYKFLLGHLDANILLESKIAQSQQFLVRVVPTGYPDKSTVKEYWWSLSRCKTGPNAGCYMVDAVIPNL